MNDRQHGFRSSKAILIAFVVIAVATAYIKLHQVSVKRHNSDKLANLIQISVVAAGSKNQQAVRMCETEINTILDQQFPELDRRGRLGAEEIASYSSCCKIIYFLARDKTRSSNTAADYVDERMQAHMGKPLGELSSDLKVAMDRFGLSLKENTVCLARDLAQASPLNSGRTITLSVDSNTDINQALRNLGINGITIGWFIPLDVWAVLRTKIAKSLASKVVRTAARLFAREVIMVPLELAGAEVPLADIVAGLAGLWTVYDVYSTRKQFEGEMRTSVENMMPQARRDIQKQVTDHIRSLLKEHERLQEEIRQRSVQEFAR